LDSSGWKIFLLGLDDVKKALVYYGVPFSFLAVYFVVLSVIGKSLEVVFYLTGLLLLGIIFLIFTIYRLNIKIDSIQKTNYSSDIEAMHRDLDGLKISISGLLEAPKETIMNRVFSQDLLFSLHDRNPKNNRFGLHTDGQYWFHVKFSGKGSVNFDYALKHGYAVSVFVISPEEYQRGDLSTHSQSKSYRGSRQFPIDGTFEKYIGLVVYDSDMYTQSNEYHVEISASNGIVCDITQVPFNIAINVR